MRPFRRLLPFVAAGLVAAACSGGAGPADVTTSPPATSSSTASPSPSSSSSASSAVASEAAATSGPVAGDLDLARANLVSEPDALTAVQADCVLNAITVEEVGLLDNFSVQFKEAVDAVADPRDMDNGAAVFPVLLKIASCVLGGDQVEEALEQASDGPIDCKDVEGPCAYGDDADLDALWDDCDDGDMEACDKLFFEAEFDTQYEQFGDSCGNTRFDGGLCSEDPDVESGSESDVSDGFDCRAVDGPCDYGDDAELDALWDDCAAGNGEACDNLFLDSPSGSRYEEFGDSCGDRGVEDSCEDVYGNGG